MADTSRGLSSAEQEQVQQWLAAAETAAKAEDWDQAITSYRRALEFDRALQGVEAKLQWAIRMRDTEALYRQGKASLAAGETEQALANFRKARYMYASRYKDLDDLIVQAQTAVQKNKWAGQPGTRTATRKAQRTQQERRVLIGGAIAILLLVIVAAFATGGFGLFKPQSNTSSVSSGAAAAIPPEQRANMYKSAPAMQIDTNKSYQATIDTSKGKIVADLYPKQAPQHVNNFVFLAREGFYNNLTFHRVVAGFVIQGGDPLGTGTGGPGYQIPPEISAKHSKGALAMARQGGPAQTTPSSGSQFYITLEAQPGLDGQYTVFGQATPDSMSVVQQIQIGDVIKSVSIEEK